MTTPTPEQVRAIITPLLHEGETLHHRPNPESSWPYVWEVRNGRLSHGFSTTSSLLEAFKPSQQKGTLKLSPAQAKFLADRPEDCVSEHLMEEFFGYEPQEGYSAEQHQQCAAAISKVYAYFGETYAGSLVSGGVIQDYGVGYKPKPIPVQDLSDMEIFVLRDCLEGSTVCGQLHFEGMDREETLAYSRAKRTLLVIVDKFRAAGLAVNFIPDM